MTILSQNITLKFQTVKCKLLLTENDMELYNGFYTNFKIICLNFTFESNLRILTYLYKSNNET